MTEAGTVATGGTERFPVHANHLGFTFADAGRLLVANDAEGAVYVKERATGALTVIRAQDKIFALDAGGDAIVTGGNDGWVRVWRRLQGVPADPAALRGWLDRATSATLDARRRPRTP